MIALVMIGAALALTSCAGGKAGDRSDVAGWRHRDGSAVSDLEFGQARVACSQTATVQNPESVTLPRQRSLTSAGVRYVSLALSTGPEPPPLVGGILGG